jgi:hypothetical protein
MYNLEFKSFEIEIAVFRAPIADGELANGTRILLIVAILFNLFLTN